MVIEESSRAELDFASRDTLYATHALHAFAAKCPPPLVRWAVETYSQPGDVVLDPMVGSGTTLVEAVLLGRSAIGADIDPLARLIAKVKATPLDLRALDMATDRLLSAIEREHEVPPPIEPSELPALPDIDRWFEPMVVRDLQLIKRNIRDTDADTDIRDFFFVAFSSLITARTSVANARDLVHSRHHFRRHSSTPDVPVLFRRRLRTMRRQMADFVDIYSVAPVRATARVLRDDARRLSLPDASAALVFTSPPYCNALDYTRAHTFSVAWLADVFGVEVADYVRLGRRYIGSERGARGGDEPVPPDVPLVNSLITAVTERDRLRGRIVARYFADMTRVLDEAGRVLQPGGRLVLVICPSHIRKVEIPTHRAFVEMACSPVFSSRRWTCEEVIERSIDDRRRLLPYMQEASGHRMRTEYVVVLRREAPDVE